MFNAATGTIQGMNLPASLDEQTTSGVRRVEAVMHTAALLAAVLAFATFIVVIVPFDQSGELRTPANETFDAIVLAVMLLATFTIVAFALACRIVIFLRIRDPRNPD